MDDRPHFNAWFTRIDDRPAMQKALTNPDANPQFREETADASAFARENAARFAGDM